MVPTSIFGAEPIPANCFAAQNLFIYAPGADIIQIIQSLVTFLSEWVLAGISDEKLVHKLYFEFFGTDINEPVKCFNNSFM
jgi:hypothetical protein